MSLNSVITNMGAMVALTSLDGTNSALANTEQQISTGYRVSSAVQDGAAFGVAQSVRSSVGALTSVNQQLGGVTGLLSTTMSGLTDISNTMSSMRDVLVKLADGNVTGSEKTSYENQYNSMLSNVKSFFADATYNSKSLIGGLSGGKAVGVTTIRNESGATYGIASFGAAGVASATALTVTSFYSALKEGAGAVGTAAVVGISLGSTTQVSAALTATGAFMKKFNDVSAALNYYGSANTYVNNQVSYNSNKIDSMNSGLGALVDADMAKESAQLAALQVQQQLGTQALTISNQAPQSLLKLFGG